MVLHRRVSLMIAFFPVLLTIIMVSCGIRDIISSVDPYSSFSVF